MIQTLLQNATLLITLSFLYGEIKRYWGTSKLKYKVILGIWFGIVSIAAMLIPYNYEPGVFYDGRSIVLTLAGLWGGGITTIISVTLAAAYRAYIGGAGIWAGLSTIIFCGLTGLFFRSILTTKVEKIPIHILLVIGVASHVLMLSSQLLLPQHSWETIKNVGIPILLVFPMAFTAIAKLLQFMDRSLANEEQLRNAEEYYREREYWLMDSQRVGMIGSYHLDITKDEWHSSPGLDQIFGIDENYPRNSASWKEIVHPDFQEEMSDYLFKEVIGNKQAFDKEYQIIRKNDDNIRWVHGHGELRLNQSGDAIEMIGTIQDITERKLGDEELRNSEERFRKVILNAPIPIMLHDENGTVLMVSEGWTHFSGYQLSDVPTFSDWAGRVYSTNHTNGEKKNSAEVRGIDPVFFNGEHEIITKDGNKRIWNFYSTPLTETSGRKLILSMAPDITQRIQIKRQLVDSEKAYRLLFENHIAVKLLINPINGNILKANKAASEFYGWSIETLERMNISEINTLPLPQVKQNLKAVRNHKRIYFEFKHRLASGQIRDVEVFSSEVNYKGLSVLHSIIHDITEKKQLMNDLISEKEKAEESERLKSAFLANVSHEIRTPLNGIVGFSNIIAENEDLPKEKKNEFASLINKSSDGLLKIIDDILDLSRLETGMTAMETQPVAVNQLLQNIYILFQNRLSGMEGFDINLELEKPEMKVSVMGDEERLTQIISNLLDNAVKFTKKGKIRFGAVLLEKNQLEFFVSDNGVGIPKEKQALIFGRFMQADTGIRRSYGGTGLGLSIVKKLLELMGSEIQLESEPGEGTRFWFQFPVFQKSVLNKDNESSKHQLKQTNNALVIKDLKILVVDDDEATCEFFKQTLDKICSKVSIANTGKLALEKIKKHKPDVLLLDIGLPDINGLDLAMEIRKSDKEIKIIAQTAFALAIDEQIALQSGCNDFMVKPINRSELMTKLAKYGTKEE